MDQIEAKIKKVQKQLRDLLISHDYAEKGFEKEAYIRYLQMQYHLTNGVQEDFFRIAGNRRFVKDRKFRDFLCNFAHEEENHYLLAEKDLKALGAETGDVPFDVKLWKGYFKQILLTNPMIRLGGTCVLENISNGSTDLLKKSIENSDFIDKSNSRFLVIHMHEELPHGDQILSALKLLDLTQTDTQELLLGMKESTIIFMRLMHWIITGKELS